MTGYVFINASNWVWHPEMFTESTGRQMRPQKLNACVTWATKCFCSSPHHWQHRVTSTNTAFPAEHSCPSNRALTRRWRAPIPGTRCWRDWLSWRRWDGLIVSERFFVSCSCSNTFLASGISTKQLHNSVQPVASWLTKWLTPHYQTTTLKYVKTLYKTSDSSKPALTWQEIVQSNV